MDHKDFYIKCMELLDNEEELIKLYTQQANERNDPYYLYILFSILNNNFINLDPKNINYIDILHKAIALEKRNGKYILEDKSFYELDYNFLVLLSKIDMNACNLFASFIALPQYNINPEDYMNEIDTEKFNNIEYDPEYIIYRSYYSSFNHKANYIYGKICLNVLNEKNFEKYVQKPLLKMRENFFKDYKNIKNLSTFERITLLHKISSKMHNDVNKMRSQ